jgi:cytidylate kinase
MSEQAGMIVTIDGPSGVGKSTISRKLAAELGLTYLDTGAMYRAVALYLKKNDCDIADVSVVQEALENITIDLIPAATEEDDVGVLLNDENVSGLIRSPEISMLASRVSALPSVRTKLTRLQQSIGGKGGIVAEGRDTGTVVFPAAKHKFFLDASARERVRRRAEQMRARGEQVDEAALLKMNSVRDKQDSERAVAPLKKAADAILVDTTGLTIDQVLARISEAIRT